MSDLSIQSAYGDYSATAQTAKLPDTGNIRTVQKARQVAEDFEAVFLSQMLQPMFKELNAEAPFGGGQGENMWRSLQVDEFGKAIAKSGGVGIADSVFREILKLQELETS